MSRRRKNQSARADAATQEAYRLLDEAFYYLRDGATERYGYDTAVEAAFVAGQAYALTADDRLMEVPQDVSAMILESMGLEPVGAFEVPPVAEYLEERTRQQMAQSPSLRRYLRGEAPADPPTVERTQRLPRALNGLETNNILEAASFELEDAQGLSVEHRVLTAVNVAQIAGVASMLSESSREQRRAERLFEQAASLALGAANECTRIHNRTPGGRKTPPRRRKISRDTRRLKNRLLAH